MNRIRAKKLFEFKHHRIKGGNYHIQKLQFLRLLKLKEQYYSIDKKDKSEIIKEVMRRITQKQIDELEHTLFKRPIL